MFPEITRDDIFRLETERLWLRWPRAADAEAMARFAGDPEVALKTANIPYPYERHHADSHILATRVKNASGEGLGLAIALKRQPNDLIGFIGVEGSANRGAARFGYWLAKPFWGQGFMGEAGAVFVDLVFSLTSVSEIVSAALPTNPESLRVLEKLGFVHAARGLYDAPARGGPVEVEYARLPRGAVRTAFGERRRKLTST